MPSTSTDRLNGLTTSVAVKAPCVVATTANITLSGLQTIDGVALAEGDRVLVKNQSTTADNGIYSASSGTWTRTADCDGVRDLRDGTLVYVAGGSTGAGFYVADASTAEITVGTTSVSFTLTSGASLAAQIASIANTSTGAGMSGFSYANNYAVSTVGAVLYRADEIDVTQAPYLLDKTGAADCGASLQDAWDDGFRGFYFPPGTYKFTTGCAFLSAAVTGIFGPAPRLRGAGMGVTFIDNRVAGDNMWEFDADTHSPFNATMGGGVYDMTIKHGASVAATVNIALKNAYHMSVERVHMYGSNTTGASHGILLENGAIADDGWNMVLIAHCRIENYSGWGIKADGATGRNEGSFTICRQVFIQACGTAPTTKAVSSLTAANPPVMGVVGHGRSNGDIVFAKNVGGMVEVGGLYTVANATTDTFELSGITGSGFTAYTSGGTIEHVTTPTSGGMIWKGQLLTMDHCAFTLNQNVALYIPGDSGLAAGARLEKTTFENNYARGLLCTGISEFEMVGGQFYASAASVVTHTLCEFDGASYPVRAVRIDGPYMRGASHNRRLVAFKISGSNAVLDTCRATRVHWDQYDTNSSAPMTRFDGWYFDSIPQECDLIVSSGTAIALAPQTTYGRGNKMPLRLRGPGGSGVLASTSGEWIESRLSSGGVSHDNTTTGSGGSALTNATRYYVYYYDNNGVKALELSETAFVRDSTFGYMVKSGDATKLYVGSVLTNGSAQFTTTGVGWLNPEYVNAGASQTGVGYFRWRDSTGDLRVSNTAPASDTDGAIVGTQS